MIDHESVRKTALFFLLTLMDEAVAQTASHKAVAQLKSGLAKNEIAPSDEQLVQILNKIYLQTKGQVPRNRALERPITWLQVDDAGPSIDAWRKFQRDATEAEVVAVALGKILGIKEDVVAAGIGVSLGTIHYRIGKGVRLLGKAAKSRESRADVRR